MLQDPDECSSSPCHTLAECFGNNKTLKYERKLGFTGDGHTCAGTKIQVCAIASRVRF